MSDAHEHARIVGFNWAGIGTAARVVFAAGLLWFGVSTLLVAVEHLPGIVGPIISGAFGAGLVAWAVQLLRAAWRRYRVSGASQGSPT